MGARQTITNGLNRLWILFSFIPYINGLGLVFVGKRASEKSWFYTGLGIEILWIFQVFVIIVSNPKYNPIVSGFFQLFLWTIIISIIISLYVRPKYEKLLKEDKYLKCKDPSISLLCGILAATPYLNCIPFIYYGAKFHKTSLMVEGIIYELFWILSIVNGNRLFVVAGLGLMIVSFMRFIVINYTNPYFSYGGARREIKKEEKPKRTISMNKTRESPKENLEYEELKISDLTSEFDRKEKQLCEIIEKRFSKNSLTYSKFMKVVDNAHENFHHEKDSALRIVKMSSSYANPKIKLDEKIEKLGLIIEKINTLSVELAINNDDDENSEKFNELLKEMDDLISSVKHYK